MLYLAKVDIEVREMDNKGVFAQRLREARQKKKMTQAELAERINASPATISAYEHEDSQKGKNPSLSNAQDIALVLGVSLDWLCGIEEKAESITADTLSPAVWLRYFLTLIESEPFTWRVEQKKEKNEYAYLFTTSVVVESKGVYDFFDAYKKLRQLVIKESIDAELYHSCMKGVIDKYASYFEPFEDSDFPQELQS